MKALLFPGFHQFFQLLISNPVTVFPNPVSVHEELTIRFGASVYGRIVIKLVNESGRMILQTYLTKVEEVLEHNISLEGFSRGMHLLHVTNNELETTQKVIIE